MPAYVEYDSNNSGGRWWLEDKDWHALAAAGWKVEWATLEHVYTAAGDYEREADGTPKLVSRGEGNSKFSSIGVKGERYMGALAKGAYKIGATNLRETAAEWERITGQSATDAGCPCCGQPHRFTLYVDGKSVESGPDARYVASWS